MTRAMAKSRPATATIMLSSSDASRDRTILLADAQAMFAAGKLVMSSGNYCIPYDRRAMLANEPVPFTPEVHAAIARCTEAFKS